MDQEKYLPLLKQFMVPLILGLSGLVFLLYGLISSNMPKQEKEDILFESAQTATADNDSEKKGKQIVIDIEGAVIKPGVYKLSEDARVQDALIKAGGMSDKADREKVAKGLNLAARVTDGGKIYIPFQGESAPPAGGAAGSIAGSSDVMGDSVSGLININTASEGELDSLSGVGPVTATKIISNRPYEKIEDLVSKKSVGQSVFEKIKDKITTY